MKILITDGDLKQIEERIVSFLESSFPDKDFRQGTPLNDILVQGFKVPISIIQTIATRFSMLRSVDGIQQLLDAQGGESDESLDSAIREILANWSIKTRQSSRSKAFINLHFSNNVALVLPASFRVFKDFERSFILAEEGPVNITSDSYQIVRNSDGSVREYIYRVTVEAEGDYIAESGSWITFDNVSTSLFKVTSDFTSLPGVSEETIQEKIGRITSGAVTERSLSNERSTAALLLDVFPNFLPIRVIGAGEPEMQRDLIKLGKNTKIHRLNHWNIYVSGDIKEARVFLGETGATSTNPRTGEVIESEDHSFLLPNSPIVNIREVRWFNANNDPSLSSYTDSDGYVRFNLMSYDEPFTDKNQYKIHPVDEESIYFWQTAFQTHRLMINPDMFPTQGEPIELVYDTIEAFEQIHDFIRNSNQRPGAGDPLVYSFYPIKVSLDLRYKPRNGVLERVDAEEAVKLLTKFIRTQRSNDPLFASEIMAEFQDNFSDISAGVYPITLNYSCLLPTGNIATFSTTEAVSLESANLLELQISDRNSMCYADENSISVSVG